MRRWCHCGAPMWREDHDQIDPTVDSVDGCRLCGLDNWTSLDVQDEARGIIPDRDGQTVDGMWWPAYGVQPDNSTDDTAATSRWLPRGASPWTAYDGPLTDDDAYRVWLRAMAPWPIGGLHGVGT